MLVIPRATMLIAANMCPVNDQDEGTNPKRRKTLALCWACSAFFPSFYLLPQFLWQVTQNHHIFQEVLRTITCYAALRRAGPSQHHMPGTPGQLTSEGQVGSKGVS